MTLTAAAAAGVVITTTGVFSPTGSDVRSAPDGAELAYQAPASTGGPASASTASASPTATPTPTPTPSKTTAHTAKPPTHESARHRPRHSSTRSSASRVVGSGSCEASYYGEGQMTASGESFDPGEMTAAHKSLPFGTRLRVTNKNNGESAIVRINDRGPYVSGRCLDLSTAAMRAVGGLGSGVIPVRYQILARA